jgi:hypothetical protein
MADFPLIWHKAAMPRPIVTYAVLFALLSSGSDAALAQESGKLIAAINRSEWTPPLRFELDLATSRYDLRLPEGKVWFFAFPAPPPRKGILPDKFMNVIRELVLEVVRTGFRDEKCESTFLEAERTGAVVINNGGPFSMTLSLPERQLDAPARCPSSAAARLERLLDSLFPAYANAKPYRKRKQAVR